MRLQVTARGIDLPEELREYVNRRIHFGLGRFAGRIKSVAVRLADANGPRGGVDKTCDIRVDTGLGQPVVVTDRRTSIHAAVAFATGRAERAIRRQIGLASPAARGSESVRRPFDRDNEERTRAC